LRYQGRITNWNDDKGFGFITPNGGGDRVFLHISAFSARQRRPLGEELVTYELAQDGKGRAQARSVAYVGERVPRPAATGRSRAPLVFALFFLIALGALVALGRLPLLVPAAYLGLSVLAFLAYAADKSAAQRNAWRTKESSLHLLELLGGWPGALVAQRTFRHKTAKASFQFVFWLMVGLNCVALGWLLSPAGAGALQSLRALSLSLGLRA